MANKKRKQAKAKKKFAQTKPVEPKTQNMDQARTVTSTMPQAGISGANRSMVKNQQQERARYALEHIQPLAEKTTEKDKKVFKALKAYASAFPPMIQMNGLGQAVAFYRMKSRDHEGYKKLYELLSEWLTKTGKPYEKYNDLLEGITQSDMYTYRLAQAEALVLLDWVKKFAKAYCVDDKNPEPGNAA